jgi:alpha-ketoglutarate-dependent taurine dioxygenase
MALTFQKLHPCFAAAVGPVDLRRVDDPQTLGEIRAGMDEYAVLVFHDQPFTDEEQLAFARRLDGELHTKTGARVLVKSRLGHEAVADISNLDERCRARTAARSTSPRTPRASSTGRCPRDGCSCTTSSSTRRSASSCTVTPGAWVTW